jgi:hypothetical protein
MMSIKLGPCGHRVELQARLEWSIPAWGGPQMRLVHTRSARAGVATS